jgi:hypothetical protein
VYQSGREGCLVVWLLTPEPDCVRLAPSTQGLLSAVMAPDEHNLYLRAGEKLFVLRRDEASGALQQLSGDAGCISSQPAAGCRVLRAPGFGGLLVSPDGRSVYVEAIGRVLLLRRDRATGALEPAAGRGACVSASVHADCLHVHGFDHYESTDNPSVEFARSASITPDGRAMLLPTGTALAVLRRDPMTGQLTQASGRRGCWGPRSRGCAALRGMARVGSVALSADGRTIVVSDAGRLAILSRDAHSGAVRQLSGPAGCLSRGRSPVCEHVRGVGDAAILAFLDRDRRVLVMSSETCGISGTGDDNCVGEDRVALLTRRRRVGAFAQPRGPEGCIVQGGPDEGCATGGVSGGIVGIGPDGVTAYLAYLDVLTVRGTGRGVRLVKNGMRLPSYVSALRFSADGRWAYGATRDAVVTLRRDRSGGLSQPHPSHLCVRPVSGNGCMMMSLGDNAELLLAAGGRDAYAVNGNGVFVLHAM